MNSALPVDERSLVNDWLRGIGAATGLRLRLDDQGVCAIGHASGLDCAVEVPEGRGVVYLHVPLLPWAGSPPGLAEHCLRLNFSSWPVDGACLALDARAGEIVMWTCRGIDALDEAAFGRLIVDLLEAAVQRRREIEDFCRGEIAALSPSEPDLALLRG